MDGSRDLDEGMEVGIEQISPAWTALTRRGGCYTGQARRYFSKRRTQAGCRGRGALPPPWQLGPDVRPIRKHPSGRSPTRWSRGEGRGSRWRGRRLPSAGDRPPRGEVRRKGKALCRGAVAVGEIPGVTEYHRGERAAAACPASADGASPRSGESPERERFYNVWRGMRRPYGKQRGAPQRRTPRRL